MVSHAKSGTGSSNEDRRNIEAHEIRADAATPTVGANAHVIYAGDFNLTDSSELAYQAMISSSVAGGVGQAIDMLNPTNDWSDTSTFKGLLTETATSLSFRDDFQFVTSPMLYQPGMQLVPNTLTAFGNGGGIYHQSVTSGANSAALTDSSEPIDCFVGADHGYRSSTHRGRLPLFRPRA